MIQLFTQTQNDLEEGAPGRRLRRIVMSQTQRPGAKDAADQQQSNIEQLKSIYERLTAVYVKCVQCMLKVCLRACGVLRLQQNNMTCRLLLRLKY